MLQQSYGNDLMDIVAGGHLDQQTVNWLEDRSQTMRANLSSAAASFFDQARTVYQMISASDAVQALRNLTAKVDNVWQSNGIYQCHTIEQLQTANPVMQRYIMAHEGLRDLYLNNSAEGYADSYVNHHGNALGIHHYDWRRVMDEVVVATDQYCEFNHFYEIIPEGDRELTLHEKVDLLRTWNMVDVALSEAELDPSSPIGNLL